MLAQLFRLVSRFAFIRRNIWKRWYNILAGKYIDPEWTFMNYGFLDGELQLHLDDRDEPNRYCIQLYATVASAADVKGKHVLEVGSGRGGGAEFVHRYLKPATLEGMDFAASSVKLSNNFHAKDGLSFTQGDAENMPYPDIKFDVILNVESSHCYGDMKKFVSEVERVLKPGGLFSWADLRSTEGMAVVHKIFNDSEMDIIEEEDIHNNVLSALKADSDRKLAIIEKKTPRLLLNTFKDYAGINGSKISQALNNGIAQYHRVLMQKPLNSR